MYQLQLGTLWRLRQWRKLLNFIDSLPGNSRTNEAMANDEDYLRAVVKAHGKLPSGPKNPPISTWTAEAGLLADVIDELRALKIITIKANGGSNAGQPERVLRPKSPYEKIEMETKLDRHKAMVARLIPTTPEDPPSA